MKYFSLLFFLSLGYHVHAQVADSAALTGFTDAVLEMQNSELFRHGSLAVNVKAVKTGENIFSINQERSLPSASILKLITTATVLSVYGGDYRFSTFLEYKGTVSSDTLIGDLYVRGTGDPSLGSSRLKGYPSRTELLTRWVNAVKKLGIRYIKGRIIGDASYFDNLTMASTWIWGDIGNYYGAGVQGLNFNENQYVARFKAGAEVGDPAEFTGIEPYIPYLTFQNQVMTGERGSGDQTIFYGDPLGTRIVLTGTIPAGATSFPVKGAIPDAAKYVAFALKNSLESFGIQHIETGGPGTSLSAPAVVLDEYKSPPLKELCKETNLWSINLFADSFLKLVGKRLGGATDFDSSVKALTNYWIARRADLRGFMIKDGSGLSPSGSVTAQNITEILAAVKKENSFNDFYQGIAVLGQTGTVRNIGKGTRAAGNVRAKSGSIEGTRAYAGYVTSRSGELLAFTFIAHKYQSGSQKAVGEQLGRLMILLGGF
ncbi:D-alanyl-D-alanine carboxypeptidase DacC [Dyadobacter sp. CECT 9275]|uniref:D-alanyl-D-alanine carboxypeptidase DacC n=1 Tax=Dyadobacter helix TaxID=2822344 RepID=A0A916J8I8_9BACT|nr:D-alanyl-D-alanine carboxypeptidase/D-alanyl-D-alanine-endopeptidase [Dyadobacter sp. CECT 9275]CAG4993718.1 D-alanyl-D-alanine carboxypeptidase DacC [Dyadobacter sp. CECT 9275]